jgi:hypothetical protein
MSITDFIPVLEERFSNLTINGQLCNRNKLNSFRIFAKQQLYIPFQLHKKEAFNYYTQP